MNVTILVDYDNLQPHQKAAGLIDLTMRVLMQLPPTTTDRGACELRLYGGWYEESTMTRLAQELSVSLQKDFPAIIRVPNQSGKTTRHTVTGSLAMALSEDPGHHLLNTFRKKEKVHNVRVESPQAIGCKNPNCVLPLLKKLLKNGSCPLANCTTTSTNLAYRLEQKLVDTMLTCDLLYAQTQALDYIVLVSDDDDFIPPIRTLLFRGTSIVLARPKSNSQRKQVIVGTTRLHELEL